MFARTIRPLGALALVGLIAGCSDSPVAPLDYDADLLETFETMALNANRDGDADGAAAFSSGALAIRNGVRPTDIVVLVDGAPVPHKALVAAVVRENASVAGGQPILMRSLMAWSGAHPVQTMLEVSLLADQATFGPPSALTAQLLNATRARGWFADLVAKVRYLATGGTAGIQVAEIGSACERPLAHRPALRCYKARFNVQVDGEFHRRNLGDPLVSAETRLTIEVDAEGVGGVIVAPAGAFGTP